LELLLAPIEYSNTVRFIISIIKGVEL